MSASLRERARKLASRQYFDIVRLDETTQGEPIFIAMTPELEGCMSQGHTVEQAKKNLFEARIDYIQSLLEDDLQVPAPKQRITVTSAVESNTFIVNYEADEGDKEGDTIFLQQPLEASYDDALVSP